MSLDFGSGEVDHLVLTDTIPVLLNKVRNLIHDTTIGRYCAGLEYAWHGKLRFNQPVHGTIEIHHVKDHFPIAIYAAYHAELEHMGEASSAVMAQLGMLGDWYLPQRPPFGDGVLESVGVTELTHYKVDQLEVMEEGLWLAFRRIFEDVDKRMIFGVDEYHAGH